ncbi:MAG TPA: ATP-binding protein, partial [Trueperaceae bacterium]
SSGGDRAWTANQNKATREALIRRLRGAAKYVRTLVRGDLTAKEVARARLDILDAPEQIQVVDIHNLAPLAQMFVVGVLLRQVFEAQESRTGRGQVFVVLDELNKYAPAEGDSPIKDVLLDIAERGRSMGIVLIGAQQTASEVERRVVSNAAIRIVGRLDAAEAERPEYRFMPGSFRLRSIILAPGTMIVHQPDVPSPIMLSFPFPAWATRRKEAEMAVSDAEALDVLGG